MNSKTKHMIDALTIALKQLEEWEVRIDYEYGDCRSLRELEYDGCLSEATIAVRNALKYAGD